ncbi:MAG: ABC transporter substrate-binding protein [Vampirovibrionales bacterium]|nr:ABC transporter substrate-binding protein [Vampirovibrionales bacterium]
MRWMPAIVIALAACVFLITGCQRDASKPSSSSLRDVTLRLWTLQMGAFSPLIRQSIREFEKTHPGVHVQWEDLPFTEGKKRAIAAILSPSVPDVINLNPGFAAILAQRSALINMNTALTPSEQAAYVPVVWQATQMQQSPVRTVSVGIPWYVTTTITLANQALLPKKQNQTVIPESWSQVSTLASWLEQKHSAKVMMPTLSEGGSFLKLLRREGIEPISTSNGCLQWSDDARVAQRLQFFKLLFARRLIPAEALTEGHRASVEQYLAARLALLSIGGNFLSSVRDNAPEVYASTNIAPAFPQEGFKQNGYLDVSPMVLVVPVKSRHRRLAVALAKHLTQSSFQLALARSVAVLPSILDAYLDDPAFFGLSTVKTHSLPMSLESRARALAAWQLLNAKVTNPLLINDAQINAAVDFAVQSALLNQVSIDEALKQAEHAVNASFCD